MQYVSPALSTYEVMRPSFRIYKFEGGLLSDYDQYASDMHYYNQLAEKGVYDLKYEREYSFKEEYGLKGLDANELGRLYRMLKDKDSEEAKKYVLHYTDKDPKLDFRKKMKEAQCLLDDDIGEVLSCLEPYTYTKDRYAIIQLIFRKLFISEILIPK